MSDTNGPLLLYVEDEPLIRELGVTTLEDAGFSVFAVGTGAEALTALKDAGQSIKALITDIDLPARLNGWEVARHARELFPEMPVIYVSGGSAADWPARGVPGSVILSKPYAAAQLVVAVSTATVEAVKSAGED